MSSMAQRANILSLVASTINYVQMTNDDVISSAILQVPSFSLLSQVLTWEHNTNAFVVQDGDETQPCSVRVAGSDLPGVRCHIYAKATHSVSIPAPIYCEFRLDTLINYSLTCFFVSRCGCKLLFLEYEGWFSLFYSWSVPGVYSTKLEFADGFRDVALIDCWLSGWVDMGGQLFIDGCSSCICSELCVTFHFSCCIYLRADRLLNFGHYIIQSIF